jgi:(3S)-malyl-CoA thioesterase
MSLTEFLPPRSALYLPASNLRAIEKAQTLPADMIILDLEDAVKPDAKDAARGAAVAAVSAGFGKRLCAIRINGPTTRWHEDDLAAVASARPDFVVIPKVQEIDLVESVADRTRRPVLAMIETPYAVLHAHLIVLAPGLVGLIAGTNDLANELRLPPGVPRANMAVALQTIVLAARARGIMVLDGVFNALDDPQGLVRECAEGRLLGFDGKTLIHPNQIEAANSAYSPSEAELDDARALVMAASGGAERFRDRMIESMHVEMAQRLIERADAQRAGAH